MPLVCFAASLCLFNDERFRARVLFPNAVGEIARAVLEQHDKTKSENDEQKQPEEAP